MREGDKRIGVGCRFGQHAQIIAQHTIAQGADSGHEVTLPTELHKPFTTIIGVSYQVRQEVRCLASRTRGHDIHRLGGHGVVFLALLHIPGAVLRHGHIGIQAVCKSGEPLVVVLARGAEDGYLVAACAPHGKANRHIDHRIGRLMKP